MNHSLQRGRARAGAEIKPIHAGGTGQVAGFNGAAPARARKCGRLALGVPWCIWLQRGRARAGAEILRGEAVNIFFSMLQRGRARAGAEIGVMYCLHFGQHFGFNGAAPARARKSSRFALRDDVSYPLLQRGRARAGAEIGIAGMCSTVAALASTGPRPRGRGNGILPRLRRHAQGGFNGAAPARARKFR